jgi:hypothetical protein
VIVGATFRVDGLTSPRLFAKSNGTVENEVPPFSMTFSLDGGASPVQRAAPS